MDMVSPMKWKDGRYQGRGMYRTQDGQRFEGEFKSDPQEWKGSMVFREWRQV